MGIFRQFPYSNFHDMNMDEIIKICRELQDAWAATSAEWASYKDFIDNYFANLDVSAEVLAAIRTLARTGELNTIIDPVIIAETADWLAEHITITEGATVIDDTLSIAGAAADAKATGDAINVIKNDIGVINVEFTAVQGEYIGSDSTKKTSGNFSRSVPIPVTKGWVIEFTAAGYSTNVAMIATSNAEATSFNAKVNSTDNAVHTFSYIVESDGYIVVSYLTNYVHNLVIKNLFSNKGLEKRIADIENSNAEYLSYEANTKVIIEDAATTVGIAGKFVSSNSDLSTSTNFNISAPITLQKGESIIFYARGYNQNVAVLARENTDSTFTALVVCVDSNINRYVFTATDTANVVITSHINYPPHYSIVSSLFGTLENRISGKDFVAFATMGVIGDSLASGASNYGVDGAADRPVYSWGKYIEREHGIAASLFSSGGATTRSWLLQAYGLTALQNADPLDCYIIGLGVNDAYSMGSSYLGTVSDVHVGNEDLNADSYYGNYSRIIAAIKTKSPRAKIICLTNPRGRSGNALNFNTAIKEIVPLYTNTFIIDLTQDDFYNSADFRDTWNGAHSTAPGYKLIARNIYNHISDLIQNNISSFIDIQWIVENHD